MEIRKSFLKDKHGGFSIPNSNTFSFPATWTTSVEDLDFLNSDSKYLKSSEVTSGKFQTGHHKLLVSSQDGPCHHNEDLLSSDTVNPLVAESEGL